MLARIFLFLLPYFLSVPFVYASGAPIAVSGKGVYSKSKLLLLCEKDNALLEDIARIIRFDLHFTDQIEVELKKASLFPGKKTLEKLFNSGTSLCAFLSSEKLQGSSDIVSDQKPTALHLILKDVRNDQTILDTSIDTSQKDVLMSAHKSASELLSPLTGETGVFLSHIAYCKQLSPTHKVVCISDYACSKEIVVSDEKSINVIPAWHSIKPLLFYTQLAHESNRLIAVDVTNGKRKVVTSFSGLNMQPSVSQDGKNVVLCLSRSGNSELYMFDQEASKAFGRRSYRQLTENKGNNVSPSLLPSGDIIFCSDFETGTPQIYYMHTPSKKVHCLTSGGYCSSPSYCERTREIFFSKPIGGTFQIFKLVLDEHNKAGKEVQLTFCRGDKQNPAVSPCGKYVLFSFRTPFDDGKGTMTVQIAALNCMSKLIRILTKSREEKSFPAWRSISTEALDKLFLQHA